MIQNENFGAIANPPNACRFVSAGGNDEISIRAKGASIETITRSEWRRDRFTGVHVENSCFAQPLNRQKAPAIWTESHYVDPFWGRPQLHEFWTLTEYATKSKAIQRCQVPILLFQG